MSARDVIGGLATHERASSTRIGLDEGLLQNRLGHVRVVNDLGWSFCNAILNFRASVMINVKLDNVLSIFAELVTSAMGMHRPCSRSSGTGGGGTRECDSAGSRSTITGAMW